MARSLSGRWVAGALVVLVGVLLLLVTLEVLVMEDAWGWLPLPFLLVGLWLLLRSRFRNLVGPGMLVAIAGVFQVRNFGFVSDGTIGRWWPLAVILFGVLVLLSRSRVTKRAERLRREGEVSLVGVFGEGRGRMETGPFSGAELVGVFGDVVLDLRGATVPVRPGVVDAVGVFGDVRVRAPGGWTVEVDAVSVFGEIVDARSGMEEAEEATEPSRPDLLVTGVAVFGDVRIED